MEVKGKIVCKKSDNKAFKLGEDWYNVNTTVVPYLEKMNKGDEIVVTFEKKGVARYVSKIVSVAGAVIKEEKTETTSSTGFACAVCGKELKDDRFKICYMCNKKGLKPKSKIEEEAPKAEKSTYKSYDNPEKTAQIMRGNALNAAGAAVSGNLQGTDPDTIAQALIMIAERALEWLKAE